MNVEELMAELAKYPPDTEVKRYSDVYEVGTDIETVTFEPAQPERVYGSGLRFGPDPAQVVLR